MMEVQKIKSNGESNPNPATQDRTSLQMGAARNLRNGTISPIKEAHCGPIAQCSIFFRRLTRDTPFAGSHATMLISDHFLPGFPVIM